VLLVIDFFFLTKFSLLSFVLYVLLLKTVFQTGSANKVHWDDKNWNSPVIIESENDLGWKGTTVLIQFQPPCYVQGCQPPAQGAQSHIQRGLECLQGWGNGLHIAHSVLSRSCSSYGQVPSTSCASSMYFNGLRWTLVPNIPSQFAGEQHHFRHSKSWCWRCREHDGLCCCALLCLGWLHLYFFLPGMFHILAKLVVLTKQKCLFWNLCYFVHRDL